MSCWVCDSPSRSIWKQRNLLSTLSPQDLAITDKRYGVTLELWQCGDCGFIYADGNEIGELVELYEQIEDEGYQDTQQTRRMQMRWIVEQAIKTNPEAKTLLDIGAGIGLLVDESRNHGLEAVGVEPSRRLAEYGIQQLGAHLLQGAVPHPSLSGRSFDLVTMIDVLEHVGRPLDLLSVAREYLSPKGLMVVVTPDIRSAAARLMGQSWWHLRAAHVGYFSEKTFSMAAKKAGLIVIGKRRALWVFPIWYITERLGQYLPVNHLNKWALRQPVLGRIYQHEIHLDLRDSWLLFLRAA